jgi:hypothetical protein
LASETEHGLLRSRSRAHAPTLDMEHSHLSRCDDGWRCGTARFDRRRADRRNCRRCARCFAGLHLRSTSMRMAEPAGSHQQRFPAMTSPRRCGRDRWRSPALRTCRTLPSLPGVKQASSPPLGRRNTALSTNIILTGSIGWTRWSLGTACAERFPQPISRRRIAPDSPRLWVMWKGSIF